MSERFFHVFPKTFFFIVFFVAPGPERFFFVFCLFVCLFSGVDLSLGDRIMCVLASILTVVHLCIIFVLRHLVIVTARD